MSIRAVELLASGVVQRLQTIMGRSNNPLRLPPRRENPSLPSLFVMSIHSYDFLSPKL